MADAGKKDFQAALDADPKKEMSPAAKKFVEGDKELNKLVKNFTFQEKVQLDPRKWSKNTLNSGVYAVARYEIKIFAARLSEIAKAGVVDKNVLAEVKKLHAKTQKYIDNKLSLAVEELANDKVDNSKALKDGKAAMSKIENLELKDAFSKPRSDVVAKMEAIAKAKEKDVASNIKKAADAVVKHAADFDQTGREAQAAVSYLLKIIKDNKSSETEELKKFAKKANDEASDFQSFVSECSDFGDALDELGKMLKGGKMTPDDASGQAAKFKKMTSIDKTATDALKSAKMLKESFDKIVKLLK